MDPWRRENARFFADEFKLDYEAWETALENAKRPVQPASDEEKEAAKCDVSAEHEVSVINLRGAGLGRPSCRGVVGAAAMPSPPLRHKRLAKNSLPAEVQPTSLMSRTVLPSGYSPAAGTVAL